MENMNMVNEGLLFFLTLALHQMRYVRENRCTPELKAGQYLQTEVFLVP